MNLGVLHSYAWGQITVYLFCHFSPLGLTALENLTWLKYVASFE